MVAPDKLIRGMVIDEELKAEIERRYNGWDDLRQQLASLEQEVEQCCYGESLAFAAMRQQLATMTADRAEWKEAHDAGRLAERVVTIKDDDDLRFIKRVLEGNNPAEKDKESAYS